MQKSSKLEPDLLVTNMHLLPEFGNSINEFSKDEIRVNHRVYTALSGYTNITMVKSLGLFMLSMADILSNKNPNIILLSGDRGEQLVAAIAGLHANIPVAHIQAGELSGNVDGVARHAITRFAHIHFASNEDAKQRLLRMGEEDFRIFLVGAPQLDEFVQNKIMSAQEIKEKYSFDLSKPIILVVQHSVTEQALEAGEQMMATMQAVISLNCQTLVIYPNNDAGSLAIQGCIQKNRNINIKVERNVSREAYGGLLKVASVLVGNSSSGIIEAPFFKLPAVNIGRRQENRLQAKNVINVPVHEPKAIVEAIKKAISKEFRNSLKDTINPYGDGYASKRIVKILETISIDEKLLFKKIT
jgi:GDP/UDP-N,N'-diacetylbacillosamine 2-epimerase (hydrolysing)